MSKRFMDWNGDPSAPAYWWHEQQGGEVAVEMVQDMEEIFRRNHAIREHLNPYSPEGDYLMEASIPVTVIEIWRQQYGIDFYKMSDPDQMKFIDRILGSNEWYKLRTSKGRL
jgi:hypothetical protein